MDDFTKHESLSKHGQDVAHEAAGTVQAGISSTGRSPNETTTEMAGKAQELGSNTAPMLDKMTDQAQKLIQQGRDVVQDTTQRVREKATDISDTAISYTKDEPLKAVLISAAVGALLMSMILLMSRSSR